MIEPQKTPYPAPTGKGAKCQGASEATFDVPFVESLSHAVNAGSGGAERAGRSRPQGGPSGSSALPCQNSNNSNQPAKRYRLKPIPGQNGLFKDKDGDKRVWRTIDSDTIERLGVPTSAEAKAAFHLKRNVASFIEYWGRNHVLFFTLTDEASLHPTQFARRWNSFLVKNGSWMQSFIRVLEPQKQGRPHYHVLAAVEWDTRPENFDWEAFDDCNRERATNGPSNLFRELRSRYRSSTAPDLVIMWSLLRKVLPRYGLGRSELLPLRKGKEAVSEYVGKYLEAGLMLRKHSWKGCRRIEFDRRAKAQWISCTRVFAWVSPGASKWRKRVSEIAAALNVTDMNGIKRKLGDRWAYRIRDSVTLSTASEWSYYMEYLKNEYFPEPADSNVSTLGELGEDRIARLALKTLNIPYI